MKIILKQKGFTLVEVLLYVAIISALMLIMSVFLFLLLESKTKAETVWTVNTDGARTVRILTQTIRSAQSISVPAQGGSGNSLTLTVAEGSKNPTVINSAGSNIQIKEGVGTIVPLTSSKSVVSNLNFQNLSRGSSPGIVRFSFIISHANSSGRNEYNFSKTFYGSASLR